MPINTYKRDLEKHMHHRLDIYLDDDNCNTIQKKNESTTFFILRFILNLFKKEKKSKATLLMYLQTLPVPTTL